MAKSVVKSSLIVSLSIFGSRVLGLARDVIIATLFGATSLTDAFFVAFRIPNLLRRIFAEGAFSSAFTPAFSRKLKVSREEAKKFAGEFFSILLLSLLITVVLGELLAPLIVKLVAPGLPEEQYPLTVRLLREMFPYIFLVSLVAFYGGILNGFEHFFAPAFSTALFNLSLIASALLLYDKLSVEALAVGVIAGGAFQVLLQLIFLKRLNFPVKPLLGLSKEVKETLKNIIPGIFGFAVRQFSMLIDTVLASFLTAGAISYLYYANRFVQLPLGMFAIGLSQVLLPRLAKRSRKSFEKELLTGLTLCSAIVIPASVGLIFFGKPIVDVVFNHGNFTEKDLTGTYLVLVGYSVGLFFFSVEKIVTNAYYSLNEYRFPVVVSAVTLVFNFIVNLFLCFVLGLGASGLALGTSLTSLLNVTVLLRELERRYGISTKGELFRKANSYLLSSIPVALVSTGGALLYFSLEGFLLKVLAVTLTILIAAVTYATTLVVRKDPIISLIKEKEG
ncbi:murein biosynthesis integral membrane protein MurJ [Phorcysia thermohydrogeniphila]|uniref:Probable lipid II flippase MurJ n=1 Tax=Phorcysia thermohydrogeniphila TaxID=936138 RepID=A0A4R1GAM7_9BACT|nr:murein biosynthesis integral membrane protein MurJ [Phorcysia thermohydrogeniphila]TCK05247.1 putative peptidoglycan lipid II flippase [Phorcysia thermohydrogeniphila]